MKYLYFILFYLISFQLKAQNTVSPKRDIDSDSICLKNGIIPGHVPPQKIILFAKSVLDDRQTGF